jgi:hypothetical protein
MDDFELAKKKVYDPWIVVLELAPSNEEMQRL